MRLKKLLYVSLALIVTLIISRVLSYTSNSDISWDSIFIIFVVFGFEIVRKELQTIRRALNLGLDDDELENRIIETEYQKNRKTLS